MHHGIPSTAYVLREDERSNVDMANLAAEELSPGPWLKQLKDPAISSDAEVEVGVRSWRLGALRERLLAHHPGDSLAYLTDFCLEYQQNEDSLVDFLDGCNVVTCENNFRDADVELARNSHHMMSADVGRLAARVQPETLVLFHVSDRYTEEEWKEQLAEVREQFDRVFFPEHWGLNIEAV